MRSRTPPDLDLVKAVVDVVEVGEDLALGVGFGSQRAVCVVGVVTVPFSVLVALRRNAPGLLVAGSM